MSRILQDIEALRPYNYIEMNNVHASYERNAPSIATKTQIQWSSNIRRFNSFRFLRIGPTSKLLRSTRTMLLILFSLQTIFRNKTHMHIIIQLKFRPVLLCTRGSTTRAQQSKWSRVYATTVCKQ